MEKIEQALKDIFSCLQTAKLYGRDSVLLGRAAKKAFVSLQEALRGHGAFTIGIVGEELVIENEILFDLSNALRPTVLYLKSKGVERIAFHPGVVREELEKLIFYLAGPKEETVDNVQEYLTLQGVKNINAGKLKTASGSIKPEDIVSFLSLYESSFDKTSQTFSNFLTGGQFDHISLRFAVNNLMENLNIHGRDFLKLVTVKRYNEETYTHLLNVAILAMYFSSRLGFTHADVLDIAISALFHDVGKLFISRKILGKAEKLTEEEFDSIRSHTVLGAQILLEYVDSLGILPVVVCFEHHLKYDLSGYPRMKFVRPPHTASLIVSICDVYDALFQRRGYKMEYSPETIYNLIQKEKGRYFDPHLVERFFQVMGIWPVGTLVGLSDGRVAVVRKENEDEISLPCVEVISPEDKKEKIDLRETRNKIRIERYLNPWKEGKPFVGLI